MARERYLTSGTTLVLNDFQCPALLWNNDYSNRVVFVQDEPLASAATRLHATGVICDSSCKNLGAAGWTDFGPLSSEGGSHLFLRRDGT